MNRSAVALLALVVIMTAGCPADESPLPDPLVLGVLPDRADDALRLRYRPLADYLQVALDVRVNLVIAADYGDLVDLMATGSVDLANFGGFTFVEATRRTGAVPLVMRDVDARFTSVIIANAASAVDDLKGLEGRSFTFGSRLSTSGHLMPRHYLAQQAIEPEAFFSSINYSGSHDATVELVRDGNVEAGVVNTLVLERMIAEGEVTAGEVRVVWETPPYVDYVYAAQPSLGESARRRLIDAFLCLSPDDSEHRRVLEELDAGGFLPASLTDFTELAAIFDSLEVAP